MCGVVGRRVRRCMRIGRAFGKEHSSIRCLVSRHGGIAPAIRRRALLALTLRERGPRRLTPLDGAHRAVLMALERGKLQDLIFDNRLLFSHRALAAFLGAILRLPPARRLLATEQVRSRYLEALVRRFA